MFVDENGNPVDADGNPIEVEEVNFCSSKLM